MIDGVEREKRQLVSKLIPKIVRRDFGSIVNAAIMLYIFFQVWDQIKRPGNISLLLSTQPVKKTSKKLKK